MVALETLGHKLKFLTHPTNKSRYQYLDSYMNDMIKLREGYNCPQLSEIDPRLEVDNKYSKVLSAALVKKISD